MTPQSPSDRAALKKWSTTDLVRMVALSVPLAIIPQFEIARGLMAFGPFEHLGWGWRLVVAVPVAAVLVAIAGGLAWWFFAGSPARGTGVFSLGCLMAGLSYQLVGYVNVVMDPDPGREVVVECIRFTTRTKGEGEVEVTSWMDPNRTVTLSTRLFRREECGVRKPVLLVVHPGRLGAEWISRPPPR